MFQRCRKARFDSRAMALRALRDFHSSSTVQHGRGILNAHRCPLCGGFHLGHRRI